LCSLLYVLIHLIDENLSLLPESWTIGEKGGWEQDRSNSTLIIR